MTQKYATAPAPIKTMPPGVPYIVGNEAAERFSFYGMKAILTIFMTQHLLNSSGALDVMNKEDAMFYYHLFTMGVYFFPILGGILADKVWGKYCTILSLSIVYCFGHLALAVDETRIGLFTGLILITLGAGGIKSCVSANVGDQFGPSNSHLLAKVFSWFYFSINLGSFFSTLLTPWLLNNPAYGPKWAFGVPGVLMGVATLCFWLGRWKYVHIPPAKEKFFKETFSPEGLQALAKLSVIYIFVSPFWALFDQTGSSWVLQLKQMNRQLFPDSLSSFFSGLSSTLGLNSSWITYEVLPSQIQAANPMLVMMMIPLCSCVIYPLVGRFVRVTPLRKISTGLFLGAAAFAVSALIESSITSGHSPHYFWQLLAYVILTAAEVMVSITCLEFSYSQAPKKMKSVIMGVYLLSISLGNLFTAGVNYFIPNGDGTSKLEGAGYFWFFAILMGLVATAFIGVAANYRERTYIQDEQPAEQE